MVKIKLTCIILIFCLLTFSGIVDSPLLAQDKQEITVTIEYVPTEEKITHFNQGEEFRKQFRFNDAITEYEHVIAGSEISGKESEACYNIGLCYTWLNDLDKAADEFHEVLSNYPDDHTASAFAEYGLAWIEVQKGKYYDAIKRLQRELDKKSCMDYEHNAVMQFQIGRLYLNYLNDIKEANKAFQKVIDNYPDAKKCDHPFLDHLKKGD